MAAIDNFAQLVVDSLALVGAAAAIIGADRMLSAANRFFVNALSKSLVSNSHGVRFVDRQLIRQIDAALDRSNDGRNGSAQSIVLRNDPCSLPIVLHLVPTGESANMLCPSGATLLLVANANRQSIPSAALLRSLFALTPTEARVALHLLTGGTVTNARLALGIGEGTFRSHLKGVFAKTGARRQSDLVRLLMCFGPPDITSRKETIVQFLPNGRGKTQMIKST